MFSKAERISKQKEIDFVFDEGISFIAYPLRVIYAEKRTATEIPVSVLVSVPKKRFKRAVKRNRIKRLIREAYRLNNNELNEFLQANGKGLFIAFIYISNELHNFSTIERTMKKVLTGLKEKTA
ncbi:ribonuclease P protein component [Bacteroidia bacterium]|nr:ribonuclease P protein component [Bacteroidia bacterium]